MTGYLKLRDYAIQSIQVYREQKGDRPVGIRRLHYWIVSKAEKDRIVLRWRKGSDGKKTWIPEPYENNKNCYDSLIDIFTKARLTGVIPADWIIDEKNPEPVWMEGREPIEIGFNYELRLGMGSLPGVYSDYMPSWDEYVDGIEIGATIRGGRFISQDYRIAVFVEKATNEHSMRELCQKHGADLFIFSGQASTTRVIEFAYAAKEEGKPCCLLYINDADPGGMDMATSVYDKIVTVYPDGDHIFEIVALTPDQIRNYDLPPAFALESKGDNDGTKTRFVEQYEGLDPRELDALDEDVILSELERSLSKYSNLNRDREAIKAAKDRAFDQLEMVKGNTYQGLSEVYESYESVRDEFNRTIREIEGVLEPYRGKLRDIENKQIRVKDRIIQVIENQGVKRDLFLSNL